MVKNSSSTLEAKGLRCPLPLLKLKQWLANAENGDQLRLIVDDQRSIDDVPKWLATTVHQLIDIQHNADGVVIQVQKQDD